MIRAGVLDYGMGNLRSVAKALEAAGARAAVTDDRSALEKSDLLVLPGQGAFGGAVEALGRTLAGFVRGWLREGRPYLGICLGLQLLFESSEEAPGRRGLGFLPGRVRRFRVKGPGLKVPHMGWNLAAPRRKSALLPAAEHFYFVHSFYAAPEEDSAVLADTPYGGPFCSAVARGNVVATQFHPEKSGDAGRRFLRGVLKKFSKGT